MTGPMIGPITMGTPMMLMTRPMRCGPAARARIDWPTGSSMPPPMPWSTRKAMSELADQARPHRLEPMMKRAERGHPDQLRPEAVDGPAGDGDDQGQGEQVAVDTHWIVVTETWKSRPRVARATATIVVSRIDMIEPRTTTVEVRRSSGVRVKASAWVRAMGILHITQRYGVVKEFRRCDNRAMGLAEDAFERLRRIVFEGEHVERMAALGVRMKLSPGVIKTLMRLAKEDGVSMGEMARGIGCDPSYITALVDDLDERGPGPPGARARTTGGSRSSC